MLPRPMPPLVQTDPLILVDPAMDASVVSSSPSEAVSSSPPVVSMEASTPSSFSLIDLAQAKFMSAITPEEDKDNDHDHRHPPSHHTSWGGPFHLHQKSSPPPSLSGDHHISATDPYPGGDSYPGAAYNGDDDTDDGILAMALAGLVLWLAVSVVVVTSFIRREKRRETMLKFWTAIDGNRDIKAALDSND